ncbi:undecaprenyldiphospho-muramoylpentapeptide beta-N-acetylglucosaminyltransferase [Paenibacillus azoreducens]|uniref:UDP-N-acetylglucosamine--N-acetylmuramyl-(pentapeptide) pyrophosphoryl-undecaprenol N-acetylglucosamine transferase n=1 Tax=Paenibacillus azoreducens TaxID=116718 RepID=A0A919YG71_9BACL|nr:undecaprenyldiphospho-muramoylpentapeptide beta-N-acetylglucosaminyltransferase [Paenibacillus azoreducens]GIO50612.1 UDP-N-acetylglucosamine--N-acetylmuramyl-(pentapeptide) pyrophosphoryl-undecaprenol N-acetylglucosamine transferase 3 [Paenibacillus azoreducens]
MQRRIVLTGGGSAGHVTANLVLISRLLEEGWDIHYIGSKYGIERELVACLKNVRYYPISTGKLRRYWAWANVTDLFKLLLGIVQAFLLLFRIKPGVMFSLGGFVAVPVVVGAALNGVPVIIFEPDLHPGLANRISRKFAQVMCTTFNKSSAFDRNVDGKMVHVGPIVREELKLGSRARGIGICGFNEEKPILLIMGGSQGAERINRIVREALPKLLKGYQVVHICGIGKMDLSFGHYAGYRQLEYAREELPDLMAMADIVVSRAGSNAIHEWLLLRKPMLLIPHAIGGTRTGQTLNAEYFKDAGYAEVLYEADLTKETFLKAVDVTYSNQKSFVDAMKASKMDGAVDKVLTLIEMAVHKQKEGTGG